MDEDKVKKALAFLVTLGDTLEDTVRDFGDMGAPSGPMYAMLMGVVNVHVYQSIMDTLVENGRLVRKGHLYFLGPNAKEK